MVPVSPNKEILQHQHFHLVGIGGAGMSGLARILLQQGYFVSGSEISPSPITIELEKLGASISFGINSQSIQNLENEPQALIYSAAVLPEHFERLYAEEKSIPQYKYSEYLGQLSKQKSTLAISGTHGKTSTTCIVASILQRSGLNPSWIIGGTPSNLSASAQWGKGEHFVVEACEYDKSFLNLTPSIALLHNVEADHLDYFGSIKKLENAFSHFCQKVDPNGKILAFADHSQAMKIALSSKRKVISYGESENAFYRAANITFNQGFPKFEVLKGNKKFLEIELPLPGKLNLLNSLAAIALADQIDVEPGQIKTSLEQPMGVKRRFELLGKIGSIPVIEDYAHHPTALQGLVRTARQVYEKKHLTLVLQIHQYGRLFHFLQGFKDALLCVDELILAPTFCARENVSEDQRNALEATLVEHLKQEGVQAIQLKEEYIPSHLKEHLTQNKMVVFAGAGDITHIAQDFLQLFSSNQAYSKKVA